MSDNRMKEFELEVQKYHHNRDFVKQKFEELDIHFDETELKNATDEIVKHCRSVAVRSYEQHTTFNALDKDQLINISAFEKCLELNGQKNIKEFLLSRENIAMQKQDEIKYSLQKNNEVGRHLRTINDMMIKDYDKNPVLMRIMSKQLLKKVFNIESNISGDATKSVKDRNFIKYFKNNETYITHKPFFWIAFSFAYTLANLNEFNYKDWLNILLKNDRLDGMFLEREKYISGDVTARHTRDTFKNISLDDYFYVYRGFLVRPDEDVRKNRKKLNNPFAHILDEGRGISFSRQIDQAIFFAGRYHFKSDLDFRKKFPTFFGNKSHSKMKRQLIKDWKKNYYGFFNQHYLDENVRRCVATFRMKKKDIITYSLMSDEDEVIADPNNVELVRYDFINDDTYFDTIENRKQRREQYPKEIVDCLNDRADEVRMEVNAMDVFSKLTLDNVSEFRLN
jgi:hypothetical protein